MHDGARIVVDAEGDELVVRWRNPEDEGAEQQAVGAAA
jgi:hypothetical protein